MRYTAYSNTSMSLRAGHSTSDAKTGQLNLGTNAYGDEIWIAGAGIPGALPGDTWLHVKLNGSTPVDAWVAIIHNGYRYCTLLDSGVVPPVDDVVEILKAVVTYKSSDGSTHEKECFPYEGIS